MAKKWYVVHTQTGYEDRVKATLEMKIAASPMKDRITQILIPTEKVSEVKDGKKKISQRKFYPGYLMIEMDLNDDSWYLVKSTTGITGFIGPGNRPLPLQEGEIKAIIKQAEEKQEKATPKVIFCVGESVKIKEGPFTNFSGTIEEIHPEKGKLRVMVPIFARSTPVELEYWQVEKL
jgi:transcriptional antiterminator NusG